MITVGFIGGGRLAAAMAALSAAAVHRTVLSDPRGSESRVVKALNNILSRHLRSLARPHGAADRSALPVAGDDEPAKATVTAFLDSIGYDAVDAGALADSWRLEPGTPVYLGPYGSSSDETGIPASAEKIRAALAAARQ